MPLSAVRRMTIYDEKTTTMRVRWEKAAGATGYMLLYSAINATQPTTEEEVRIILTHRENTVWHNESAHIHSAVDSTDLDKKRISTSACVYG